MVGYNWSQDKEQTGKNGEKKEIKLMYGADLEQTGI